MVFESSDLAALSTSTLIGSMLSSTSSSNGRTCRWKATGSWGVCNKN
jgi:hypothetical protein